MKIEIIKQTITASARKIEAGWSLKYAKDGSFTLCKMAFTVIDQAIVDGKQWYSVEVSDVISEWCASQEFTHGVDYVRINSLKGVWIDMTEEMFIILKLKWSK